MKKSAREFAEIHFNQETVFMAFEVLVNTKNNHAKT